MGLTNYHQTKYREANEKVKGAGRMESSGKEVRPCGKCGMCVMAEKNVSVTPVACYSVRCVPNFHIQGQIHDWTRTPWSRA